MARSTKALSSDVRTFLAYRILVLSNTLGTGAVRFYARRHGMPLAEWRLMATLAVVGPSSVNDLAKTLRTDKGWVSRTTAAIVAKGLAATRPDLSDGRRFQIVLTPKGCAKYAQVLPAALDRQRRLLSVLTEKERNTFDELLVKLQGQAERMVEAEMAEPATLSASKVRAGTNPRLAKARKRTGKEIT